MPVLRQTGAIASALEHFDSLPDEAHVSVKIVCGLHDCSAATAWRMVKRGTLPAPTKFSPGMTRWRVGDLRRARGQA